MARSCGSAPRAPSRLPPAPARCGHRPTATRTTTTAMMGTHLILYPLPIFRLFPGSPLRESPKPTPLDSWQTRIHKEGKMLCVSVQLFLRGLKYRKCPSSQSLAAISSTGPLWPPAHLPAGRMLSTCSVGFSLAALCLA